MDSLSLDTSIQSALSALYPPFEATAPTVLSQLFQVIEEQYKGDALRCLLNFLIPAKRILETVQQAACVEYCDRLFRCEGWPLCLREKVVIQLAPINPLHLRPGDFYLQVEPFRNQAARIVLKSLLGEQQEVERTAVPETSYPCIFTEEWLKGVNKGRHGAPLRCCILCTDQGIVKVPWLQVARPEFVDKPKATASNTAIKEQHQGDPQPSPSPFSVETRILPAKDGIAVSVRLVDSSCSRLVKVDHDMRAEKPVSQMSSSSWDSHTDRELEGDYVDLVEFTEEKKALALRRMRTQSQQYAFRPIRKTSPAPPADSTPHIRTVKFSEELCTPCSSRKMSQDSRWHRDSYMAALQNPIIFGSKLLVPDPSGTGRNLGSESEPQPLSQHHHPGHTQSHSSMKRPCTDSGARPPSQSTSIETSRNFRAAQRLHKDVRSNSDELFPVLSIVESEKGTTFGLVSPKLERRRNTEDACVPQSPTPRCPLGGHGNNAQTARSFTSQIPACSSGSPHKCSSSLLQLGLACLPGSRDRTGRAVVELYGDHQGWWSPLFSSRGLCNLLLYYHSIIRKEVSVLGMMLVMDSRNRPPPPVFCKTLQMLQEYGPHVIHRVLILVEKDSSPCLKKHPELQMEVVTSLKALHEMVEPHQLTSCLDGSFLYSHTNWLHFYQKLEPFALDLQEAAHLLHRAIGKLDSITKTDTVQDVQRCIEEQSVLMKEVLEDARLVFLQREGGAILAGLRKEQLRFPHSEDYCDAMDSVTALYNQVEEQVHLLVLKSNESMQHLEFLLNFRDLEARFKKIWEWFQSEGEKELKEANSTGETLEGVDQTFQSFSSFLAQATEQKQQVMQLVTTAEKIQGLSYPEAEAFGAVLCSFRSSLAHFWSRAQRYHAELETTVHLQQFCEKATSFAEECKQYLEQLSCSDTNTLQKYREGLHEFSEEQFQYFRNHACTLKYPAGMQIWSLAWLKCQEVGQLLEDRLQSFDQVQQAVAETPDPSSCVMEQAAPPVLSLSTAAASSTHTLCNLEERLKTMAEDRSCHVKESDDITASCFKISFRPDGKACKLTKSSVDSRKPLQIHGGKQENCSPKRLKECTGVQGGPGAWGEAVMGCECFLRHQVASKSTSKNSEVGKSPWPETMGSSTTHNHAQHCFEDRQGAGGGNGTTQEPLAWTDYPTTPKCEETISQATASGEKNSTSALKLRRIVEELLLTEREYVLSLGYVVTHYCPLLEQADVPQDLRGQRGRLFGNLEKLHDFHRHVFLRDLEACLREPLRVGRYFLRHREKFGLYALYSKNKPQSDSLLIHHGQEFFKQKQLELGDKMDLSSYLLKPVQRISKYSLLLQDMLKECETQTHSERGELQAALEVIQFQLRHGNDLLAMDDIQDCDVNLKEQGQLIRQDEFLVSFRKKKCFRHIFLFQDLILFSKTKKTEVGNDAYIYKQSFKTSEIGMTHNSGTSGLCFEIWFRRRKLQDTYTLQAKSSEVKVAWTNDLERILWQQAVHNREVRMQERVFMGIGDKPFMDIQPSDAAISNRAINCVLTGREPKMSSSSGICRSKENDNLPRPNSVGYGSSTSSSGSQSSSSSGRGSLSLNGYLCGQYWRGTKGPVESPAPRDLEEDDLDNENGTHLLIESSESSGASVSGFSSSDHSCLSAIGGVVEDSSSVSSTFPSKAGHVHNTQPNCQKCGSPELCSKRLPTAPNAQILSAAPKFEKVERKTWTEV